MQVVVVCGQSPEHTPYNPTTPGRHPTTRTSILQPRTSTLQPRTSTLQPGHTPYNPARITIPLNPKAAVSPPTIRPGQPAPLHPSPAVQEGQPAPLHPSPAHRHVQEGQRHVGQHTVLPEVRAPGTKAHTGRGGNLDWGARERGGSRVQRKHGGRGMLGGPAWCACVGGGV